MDRSRSRSRFSEWRANAARRVGLQVVLVAGLGAGCQTGRSSPQAGEHAIVGKVAGQPIYAEVVDEISIRDGIPVEQAHAQVADVLRWVAHARDQTAGTETSVDPSGARAAHLRRAAAARLWLDRWFEPAHRPQDIPDDDPVMTRALLEGRSFHPRVYRLCQLIAVPAAEAPAEREQLVADPQWQALAKPRFDRAVTRVRRYVDPADPEGCALLQSLLAFEDREADGVALRVESGGFDLDACAEPAADGSCVTPRWDPIWVAHVRPAGAHQFVAPFMTQFGWHFVLVLDVLPAQSADDPQAREVVRRQLHPAWAAKAFTREIERLQAERSVRIARPPQADAP